MTLTATNLREFPPVEENIERPSTLSQTLLAKHDKCPRSAYLYRKYKGGTPSVEMDRGTAFHLFAERAMQTMVEQGEPTMPGDVAKELAGSIMAEHPELVLPTSEQDAVRLMAWNWAEATVLDLGAGQRGEGLIGVEVPLELEIGGFKVTCRIDLVEVFGSTLYLTDYKTSLAIRKREEVERGFQGQFYALAALDGVRPGSGFSLSAGINSVWFYEKYPRFRDNDTGQLVTKEAGWTRAELLDFRDSLERNIANFESSVETGDWPARDDVKWCSQCPAASECPIPEHLRAVLDIASLADAENAFSHKMALEREGRRIQDGLRGWVKANGPVFVGDHAFDASYSESKSVKDWPELQEAMRRAAGLGETFDPSEHITLRQATKFGKRKITEEERDGCNN